MPPSADTSLQTVNKGLKINVDPQASGPLDFSQVSSSGCCEWVLGREALDSGKIAGSLRL